MNCEWIFDRRCFGHKQMLMIIMMVANACINGEENKILAISKIPYFVDDFFSFFLTNFFAFHDFVWFIIIIRTSHNSNVWFNEFSMKNHLYLFILDRNCDKKNKFFFLQIQKPIEAKERNKNHFSSYFFLASQISAFVRILFRIFSLLLLLLAICWQGVEWFFFRRFIL